MIQRVRWLGVACVAGAIAGAGGCATGNEALLDEQSARVAYLRGESFAQGEAADYGVDVFGHVATGESVRSRALPLEPPRDTPYQQFRVLMDGRERRAFFEIEHTPVAPGPGDGFTTLVDRRERFLRHHGTRLKWALLDAGLRLGMQQGPAEELVNRIVGGEPTWRDSGHDDLPGLTPGGQIDHSLQVIERVAWRAFNGFGANHAWLHFRNGVLERWEVHAESN